MLGSALPGGSARVQRPPTQGMLEVARDLDTELARYKAELNAVASNNLQRYIEAAQDLSIGHVVVPED